MTHNLNTAKESLQSMRSELRNRFPEREPIIDGLLAGLVAGKHVCLLGLAGEAKSALILAISNMLDPDAIFFKKNMSRFTTLNELVGGFDMNLYAKTGKLERVKEGTLPSAHIAFLDEVFKSNSAVANSVLDIMNEGTYEGEDVPLEFLAGASNELPDGFRRGHGGKPVNVSGDDLGAFWDRFTLRYMVEPVCKESNLWSIVMDDCFAKELGNTLTFDGLSELRSELSKRMKDDSSWDLYVKIRAQLSVEGVTLSTRRFKWLWQMLHAFSIVRDEDRAGKNSLRALGAGCWTTQDQIPIVEKVLNELGSGLSAECTEVLRLSKESMRTYGSATPEEQARMAGGLTRLLKNNIRELETSLDRSIEAREADTDDADCVDLAVGTLREYHRAIMADLA